MGKEIERKFLVINDQYKKLAYARSSIRQGYISRHKDATVRVRTSGDKAFITIKGITHGMSRDEWEYSIPHDDANAMLDRLATSAIIEKTRYLVNHDGHTWEIDEFHGAHCGLVIAEIELTEESETVSLPSFVGEEVTGNPAYYNSNLASSGQ